jgi:hypothetical protein
MNELQRRQQERTNALVTSMSAPEGIRTPNLLIRSQVLYPLSYGRNVVHSTGAYGAPQGRPRRLRDSNPGRAVSPNRISSAAP